MHIKHVSMSGFRSFRDQPDIEEFSPRHNVIVGRNGSGKSNFFDAIQFVLLNQRFATLRQEERQSLLHEGAGANVMSAFVEIVFDNSDGRLPQDTDEVFLRRTIGLKKDEFFLNKKRVTKQEVSSLLESAGFSKSNPYYIVQQGKVSALTLMKDTERLNLLKEVAGTNVYEERRCESLQIMEETNNKRDKIQEVITYIEERLQELEEEKEELGAYQQLDKDRRALEYTLYDNELRKAREDLESIEQSRGEDIRRTEQLHRDLQSTRDGIRQREQGLEAAQGRMGKLDKQKEGLDKERRELVATRTKLELEVKDTQESVAADRDSQLQLQRELEGLARSIKEKQAELDRVVTPAWEQARAAYQAAQGKLGEYRAEAEQLYAKQGRRSQFDSPEERDASLRKQIASIESCVATKRRMIQSEEQQAARLQKHIADEKDKVQRGEAELRQRHEAVAQVASEITQKTRERNDMAERRKDMWRRLETMQDRMGELRDTKQRAERDLKSSVPRSVQGGLEAVEKIVRKEGIKGYFGPVIENITLRDPKFATVVEVAGGNSLFHVIVDNDDTAALLVQRLEQGKLGRITFMPLNRLRVKQQQYPDSPDVVPLLDTAIEYRPEVKGAMQQLFGKKLIARSQEVAAQFAEQCNMDALTMDGDVVNRKGGMEGGYRDSQNSRLRAVDQIRSSSAEIEALDREYQELKRAVVEVDQGVTHLMGEIQKLEGKRDRLKMALKALTDELEASRRSIRQAQEALDKVTDQLPSLRAEAEHDQSRIDGLKGELGTPLVTSLSNAEQARLKELNHTKQPELKKQVAKLLLAMEEKAGAREKLLALLKDNLLKRQDELGALVDPENGGVGTGRNAGEAQERTEALTLKTSELAQVTKQLDRVKDELAELEEEAGNHKQQIRTLTDELDGLRSKEQQDTEKLNEAAKMAEKLHTKRALLQQKRESNTLKIQELGSLPSRELETFRGLGAKQLMKRLHECNEKLKKYSHVNKKALDQYVNFSEQRLTLVDRKDELDKGAKAIQELVETLDQQKDEAILRTFKGVSHHFSKVFEELVPTGFGKLIMKTRTDEEQEAAEEDEEEETEGETEGEDATSGADDTDGEGEVAASGRKKSSAKAKGKKGKKKVKGKGKGTKKKADKGKGKAADAKGKPGEVHISEFVGVQVKVSFTGTGETFLMSQLSGGQKALVALALIFAIQRCDPAPFYLFDEIDQALDSNYRAAVAALIQRQAMSSSNPTQFITTTFRPELVSVGSKHYGIAHQNKVSNIHELTKEDALAFVANLMNEEEVVGKQLAQPMSAARRPKGAPAQRTTVRPRQLAQEPDEEDHAEVDEEEGAPEGAEEGDEEEDQASDYEGQTDDSTSSPPHQKASGSRSGPTSKRRKTKS